MKQSNETSSVATKNTRLNDQIFLSERGLLIDISIWKVWVLIVASTFLLI